MPQFSRGTLSIKDLMKLRSVFILDVEGFFENRIDFPLCGRKQNTTGLPVDE
jgi:hypothetical protein